MSAPPPAATSRAGEFRDRLVVLGIRVDQPVDEFVDAHFVARDLSGERKDFGDGGRAG